MNTIGTLERATQNRVLNLFQHELGYAYIGDLHDQDNLNIRELDLANYLDQACTELAPEADDRHKLISLAIQKLTTAANNSSQPLYDRNREVYNLLRYGIIVTLNDASLRIYPINWQSPLANNFTVAEEVTVKPSDPAAHVKRPDIVLYVNGIALAVLELKSGSTDVAKAMRQNYDNQKPQFIQSFFSTMQFTFAGNDSQGLRYGTSGTTEKYYLTWKEERPDWKPADGSAQKYLTDADYGDKGLLDRALLQLCDKTRLLDLIHNFVVFDAGTKKLCRHNQYFGVKAAQVYVKRQQGGIIWHTQGSGKSLTMVWFAKWIRENVQDPRVLIITDRTELDDQIEKVFMGVKESIYRTKSGADLIGTLDKSEEWLLCSLIHKFGNKQDSDQDKAADDRYKKADVKAYVDAVKAALPKDFAPKGNLFVFVDECHRTQAGALNEAMKAILPTAVFIGFTGTPLLKDDKRKSIEVFGGYIHTYKFDEAVRDGVVVDLQYEARDIEQNLTSPAKVDQWFDVKTKGLTPIAKAQLKARWGTMQKVLSSVSRLQQLVADVLLDMETRDRLKSGKGNAMLVADSIYEACKLYELFCKTSLAGKCAIVTSYEPRAADIKGEDSGEGQTEVIQKYEIYRQMLADWFNEPPEVAATKVEQFEKQAKKRFIEEPGRLKLLIVVDKLLTGFDAPPATYLYINSEMRDHGLFQAICRVNRLDDDKDYGYIIDYKNLFEALEGTAKDYTSGALNGYDKDDIAGLLKDRLVKAKERLEDALEAVRALCEKVDPPKDDNAYYRYFSSKEPGNADQLKANEPQRLALYKGVAALVRAYAAVANEMPEAGYTDVEARFIRGDVVFFEDLRSRIKLHSGDAIDLKQYEPAMRHLIDTYIKAEDSKVVSQFEDKSLIQLIVERGVTAVESLPPRIGTSQKTTSETIENNVRKLILDESPINPKYYEEMSKLLDALITQRKNDAIAYQEYLKQIVALARDAKNGPSATARPPSLDTPAKRALYDNLGQNEALALAVHTAVRDSKQDGWRNHKLKLKAVRQGMSAVLGDDDLVDLTLEIVKAQHEY